MTSPLRKGWCPGALRPMAAKDGWLVRLRITGGILPSATAHALADLAARHGNGRFDLSARGNLQMRGVTDAGLPALHAGLRDLALLDRDAEAEAVRNVVASPLAGLHAGPDIRPLVATLGDRLAGDPRLHALPTKVVFLIDDGAAPSLGGLEADVRFEWNVAANAFAVALGGTRAEASRVGFCTAHDLVDRAVTIARAALDLFAATPDARRVRDLLAAHPPLELSRVFGMIAEVPAPAPAVKPPEVVGWHTFADVPVLGLGVPFGRLDADMLRAAAEGAAATPRRELRLTPWRAIFVPQAPRDARALDGFITDPDDPRLRVAACVGIDGCVRGTTSTHRDATRFAQQMAAYPNLTLHVSGCEKGCAKPSPAPLTLVARQGRYDLVRAGRAGDRPSGTGLDVAAVCAALTRDAT